jgi:hypothetical protein
MDPRHWLGRLAGDRPGTDTGAGTTLSPDDHLDVQRTLAALGEMRPVEAFLTQAAAPVGGVAYDARLVERLARCLRFVARLAP